MADGYISQIKTPDNKVYLLKDSEKTDEKVKQTANTEDKEFPIILKNANNTTPETNVVKYAGGVTVNPSEKTVTATEFIGNIKANRVQPTIVKNWTSTSFYGANISGQDVHDLSTFWMLSVKPDSWYEPWVVRFKITTTCPAAANYYSVTYCMYSGRADGIVVFNWNERYDHAHYYTNVRTLKKAGFDAGLGHAIGINLYASNNYTNANYYRSFKLEYYDCDNCTVTILDTPIKWANWPDGTTTNYNGNNNANAVDRGLQESGDANSYDLLQMSNNYIKNGAFRFPGISMFGYDREGHAQAFSLYQSGYTSYTASASNKETRIYNTNGIDWTRGIHYNASGGSWAENADMNNITTRLAQSAVDLRYTDNCVSTASTTLSLISRKAVYIRGTLDDNGLFHVAPLDVTYRGTTYCRVWTQDIPTQVDNYVYWFIGYPYYTSAYQVNLYVENPLYWFHNGRFEEYNPPAVEQIGTAEAKDYPILLKYTNDTDNEINYIKYSNNVTADATATKPFTFNPSTGNLTVTQLKIGTKNDNMGLFPNLNNWNQIGSGSLYWYRSYINNYYGSRSHVDNWDAGKNIGIAASASAAAVLGTVNFYNTAAAGATQTKTLLTADSTANSNITITLPKTTGTLALKSELPTLSGLGGIGTISASGTAPLTLSGSKSGTTYTLTGSIADASASTSGIVNTDTQTFSGVKTFDNGLHVYGTISTQGTGSVAGTMYPGGAYHSGHNSIILHGDTAGVSGIGFTSEKATKSGTTTNINSSSDRAFIQYHAYGVTPAAEGTAPTLATSGEAGTFVIGVGNDATDTIRLQAPSAAGILHQIGANAYPIPHTTNTNGTVGGTTTPVYVDGGVIKALSYTIAKSVPADAVFTDHYAWSDITSKPETATRWPTWSEVTSKPTTFAPSAHEHNRLNSIGRLSTTATIPYNPSTEQGFRMVWNIYDGNSRSADANGSPSFDAGVINLPWDWGGYNGQIAISNTVKDNTRMQIRSASHVDNGESANPRYTPNYGAWREVVTATKATKVGDTNKPVYINATGQATAISYTIEKSVPSNAVFTDHYAWGDITGKPTKITLTGAVTGNVSLGAGDLTLSTSVNHNHNSSYLTAVGYDTTNKKIYYTKNGSNTDVVTVATLRTDMGLSNALHFIGITSTTLTDGSTTATLTAKSTNSLSKTTGFVDGDVVMDGDQLREYVWSGSAWRLLGITTSTAYTQPASTATNTWIAQVSQGTDGKITATTGSLNTSGTWSGNATTATTATNLANNPSIQASTSNTNQITITAGGKTSSAYTIPYATSAGSATSATTATYIKCTDTRNAALNPTDLDAATGVRFDFKAKGTINLTATDLYAGVMSFRPYAKNTNWSGGNAHQIAFNSEGLHWRNGGASWGNWYQILDSNNTSAANANGTAVSVICGTDATLATINDVAVKINVTKPTYTYSDVGAAPSSTVSCTAANVKSALGTGTDTTKFLNNKGDWAVPAYTTSLAWSAITSKPNLSTGNARIFYGTSNTAAGTAAKVVTCSIYDAYTAGDILVVKFDNANSASSPTLNVNSKGAKNIRKIYNGAVNTLNANSEITGTCMFVYDGTQWLLTNADYNNTYTIPTSFTITANATDGLWDLTGTSGTNAVTYALAPYSSKGTTATFYTAATNPTLTTRLNYDGYLYATKLYSGGTEVSVSGHTHSYLSSISWSGDTNLKLKQSVNGAAATDVLQFAAGSNITLTGASGKITIAGTPDTKNTAGSTNSDSKLYLIGATSQAANPQTYSDAHVFETNGAFSAKTLGVNADTDNNKVTLQWNTTDSSLDFVFA